MYTSADPCISTLGTKANKATRLKRTMLTGRYIFLQTDTILLQIDLVPAYMFKPPPHLSSRQWPAKCTKSKKCQMSKRPTLIMFPTFCGTRCREKKGG